MNRPAIDTMKEAAMPNDIDVDEVRRAFSRGEERERFGSGSKSGRSGNSTASLD